MSSSLDDSHENHLKPILLLLKPSHCLHCPHSKGLICSSLTGTTWNLLLHSETGRRETFTWSSSLLDAMLGIFLFNMITLIWGIVNFRLYYHQYFYGDTISRWLPTIAKDSPAPNFMLEFSSLRKVMCQG